MANLAVNTSTSFWTSSSNYFGQSLIWSSCHTASKAERKRSRDKTEKERQHRVVKNEGKKRKQRQTKIWKEKGQTKVRETGGEREIKRKRVERFERESSLSTHPTIRGSCVRSLAAAGEFWESKNQHAKRLYTPIQIVRELPRQFQPEMHRRISKLKS